MNPARSSGIERPSGTAIVSGIVIVTLTVATQIVLRRELAPGEFGTLNALLGLALVLLVPLAAFSRFARVELTAANAAPLHVPVLNRAAVAWGLVCMALLLVALPFLKLPRLSLQFYMLLTVAAGLLAICGRPATPARWCAIVGISAAALRLLMSAETGAIWPTAESGLAALALAGLLAGLPALRDQALSREFPLLGTWKILGPRLVPGLAGIGLAWGLALFGNADRIAAHLAFTGHGGDANSYIDYPRFDEYQSAGLFARGVLWGLLPLLIPLYRQRRALDRTTRASLRWFWIYLVVLFAASVALAFCGPLEYAIFGGPADFFLPGFAGAVFMLGLVQAVGVFALASRRYVECFLLAACGVGYTAFLFAADNPALLTGCMSGGALIALALVLLIGVIRYARSHP